MNGIQNERLAVVTGASSGIGRALAHQFADHDFDLVIAAEDAELNETATELVRRGRQVHVQQVDLATVEGVTALHNAVTGLQRPVTAAVLNAGIGVSGPFQETSLADDFRLIDLNVRSTVHLAKLLVPEMARRGDGRLLFTASIAANAPGPYLATYAASKAFVHSFAEAIRHELAETGVTVTSLMPGPTDTEFFQRADMLDTRIGAGEKDSAARVAEEAYEAIMSGRDHVVTGTASNAFQSGVARMMPDRMSAAAQARSTRPGSAHE